MLSVVPSESKLGVMRTMRSMHCGGGGPPAGCQKGRGVVIA